MGQNATGTAPHGVATFEIMVDNKPVDPSFQVLSVAIMKEINRVPAARIVIRDGDAASQTFAISSRDFFIPGKKISIKIGNDSTNKQAFAGIIIKHAIKIRENGSGELQVECRDAAVMMTLGRHSRYFQDIKDNQVFDELISEYPALKGEAGKTTLQHKQIVQHHISDWDFMLLRAEANGMLVNVNDGTVKISMPDTSTKPTMKISFGTSVLEFEAEMDARSQWGKVVANSWDYSSQVLFDSDISSAPVREPGNISGEDLARQIKQKDYQLHHSGYLQEQELQDWAQGVMQRSRLAKIRGRAKVTGTSDVKTGDMVTLAGVGDRFNGNAYVTAVKHELGNGMWDTHIQFGLDPETYASKYAADLDDKLSAGLVGSIHGLQIGKVVQLQNDPDGENRILVKVPTLDNTGRGIWTRVASPDAGNNRGAVFLPEINDEVIIGFINADPRHAVMLGMLHSSALPSPLKAEDVNNTKGFTTRSKMHVLFNDDTKTITIDTPNANKIVISEQGTNIEIKDQNSNKITMDSSGIKVESPLNIDLKAGANLSLSAGATLAIGGVSVSVKADGTIGFSGASAKLAAQGITEITGSMVKIN
ncbi:MAG: type VI secretion system tip protein VgrG [Chitinophagaceae bacterium]|nr:MAG: type VI secretion system tip protein VgrG [Chitinophagaceae bacterium]